MTALTPAETSAVILALSQAVLEDGRQLKAAEARGNTSYATCLRTEIGHSYSALQKIIGKSVDALIEDCAAELRIAGAI